MDNKIYNIVDLCKLLGIGRNTAYTLIKEEKIKGFKAGRGWLVSEEALKDYVRKETER